MSNESESVVERHSRHSSRGAGKGSAPRNCFSDAYRANYDAIFRRPSPMYEGLRYSSKSVWSQFVNTGKSSLIISSDSATTSRIIWPSRK